MSLRSYDLESRRAQTFGRNANPSGTFRRITDEDRRVKAQSLFEPLRGASEKESAHGTAELSPGFKENPVDVTSEQTKEKRGAQLDKFHTLPKTDASWDAFEKAASSNISLEDTPSSGVTLRSPTKTRSNASDKRKRHSGGLLGYISRSWGKRHSSASEKSAGKREKPRKKRKSGHRSSSSSDSDDKESKHKEMFEVKAGSESTDYPAEINELDKVLSMVVNSPGKGNQDYDLDKVTAVVLGSPTEAVPNMPKEDLTGASSGNEEVKYTHFGSPQAIWNNDNDMGHEQCDSLSEYSDEIVDVSGTKNKEAELAYKEEKAKLQDDQTSMPYTEVQPSEKPLEKQGRARSASSSSSSSSSSTSHASEAQYELPTPPQAAQHDPDHKPQKFQLEATVMLDPHQPMEQRIMTYFGPVFLSTKNSEGGKNVPIVVIPGKNRVLRSPTPSEEEQLKADDNVGGRVMKDTAAESDNQSLADTHTGGTDSSTAAELPCTSLGQDLVIAGQNIQPVGLPEEREDEGAAAERKPEPSQRAIRSEALAETESSRPEHGDSPHSTDQTNSNNNCSQSVDLSDKASVDKPIPKARQRSASASLAEKEDKDVEKSVVSSSSSSSSSSLSEKEDTSVKGYVEVLQDNTRPDLTTEANNQESEDECNNNEADGAGDSKAGGSGLSVRITPRDKSVPVDEPEIEKFQVKTQDSRRVLDLSQAVQIPVVSVASIHCDSENLKHQEKFLDLEKHTAIEPKGLDALFPPEQYQQEVVEETLVGVPSINLEAEVQGPQIKIGTEVYQVQEETPIAVQTVQHKVEQKTLELPDGTNLLTDEVRKETQDNGVVVDCAVSKELPEMENAETVERNLTDVDNHENSFGSEQTTSSSSTTDGTFSDQPDESRDSQDPNILSSKQAPAFKEVDRKVNTVGRDADGYTGVAIDKHNGHLEEIDGCASGTIIVSDSVLGEAISDKEALNKNEMLKTVEHEENDTEQLPISSHDSQVVTKTVEEKAHSSFSSSSSSSNNSDKSKAKEITASPPFDVCVCEPQQVEACKNDSWEAVEEAFENDEHLKNREIGHEPTIDLKTNNSLNKKDLEEPCQQNTSGTSSSHDSSHEKKHTSADDSGSVQSIQDQDISEANVTEKLPEIAVKDNSKGTCLEEEDKMTPRTESMDEPALSNEPHNTVNEQTEHGKNGKRSHKTRKVDGYLPEQDDKMVLEESVSPFPTASNHEEESENKTSTTLEVCETAPDELAKSEEKQDVKGKTKKAKKDKDVSPVPEKKENKAEKTEKKKSDENGRKKDKTVDTSTSTTSSGESSSSRKKSVSKLFSWPFRKHKKKEKEEEPPQPRTEDTNATENKIVDKSEPPLKAEQEQTVSENVHPRTSTPLVTPSLSVSDSETSECSSSLRKNKTPSAPSESEQSSVSRQSSEARSSRKRSSSSSSSSSSSEESTPRASRAPSPGEKSHHTTPDTTQHSSCDVTHNTSTSASVATSSVNKKKKQRKKHKDKSTAGSVSSHTGASGVPGEVTQEEFEKSLLSSPASSVVEGNRSLKQKSSKPKEKKNKKRRSANTSTVTDVNTSQLDTSIASDAHSQQKREKDKQRRNDLKRQQNTLESEKHDASEKEPREHNKEERTDGKLKKKREKRRKDEHEKRSEDRGKTKTENTSRKNKEESKPASLSDVPSNSTKREEPQSKSPSSEQSKREKPTREKPARKHPKHKDNVKDVEKMVDSKKVAAEPETKTSDGPHKELPIEKPVRRKLDKTSTSNKKKLRADEAPKSKVRQHSTSSSSSSSFTDDEIDKKKVQEKLQTMHESKPFEEKPLKSEAIELTSRAPSKNIPAPQYSEHFKDARSPPSQSDPSQSMEPARPPRTPKSQKSGKFHKLLPSIRSPSARDGDKKFDQFHDGPPQFDGQYHREDDITHDVYDDEDDAKQVVYTSSPRQDQPEYSEPRHFVVVAIDFGTTHSGYAFSFTRDPSSVYMMRRWAGEEPGVVNQKTLTSLLLTPEGEFHSFGYSARSNYLNLVPLEARHWMYFSTFKMELHHNSDLNRDTQLVASNGVRFSALRVFAHSLSFFKSHALQQLSDQAGTELLDQDIRWVITVPAIWKPPAKQFMRQAAYEAGLASANFPEQLLIALEPEAASIYCRRLRMHQLVPEQPINRPLQSPRSASCDVVNQDPAVTDLSVGSRYLIVDCGGGTVDITVHELDPSGHITELHRATGGPFGSIGVDTEFERLLCGIFGIEFVEHYKRKYPMGWVHLMTDFESRKRSASPYKSTSLNVSPPFTFINDFKKHKYDPEVAVKKYGDSEVEWSPQGMLRLTPVAMKRLFLPTVTHIKQAVGDVLNHPNARGLKYLFLVGGFAESPILQHEMRQEFGHLIKLLIPQEVSLAILKGAVLFGIDPSIVNVRRSRLTYGVGILNRFDPKRHPASKRVRRDGVDWCTDILDKYVETDQPVMLGNSVVRSYTPAKTGQLSIVLNIYCSHNPNVRFITDPGVTRCGTLCLTLPVLDSDVGGGALEGHVGRQPLPPPREIQARMSFGDTEINVVAVDIMTGRLVKASIDFLGR